MTPKVFRRRRDTGAGGLATGVLAMGQLEIARLDNDPSFPERAALGTRLFRATYGATPVATCRRRVLDEAQEAVGNAAEQCFSERAADADAFREKYGQNANKRNAFGRCVSMLAKKELAEEVVETLNAANTLADADL